MTAQESDPNFKKNPCRSVCIRVPFRSDGSEYDGALAPNARARYSVAIAHGLHG